ncbi:DoxX family protein [Shimwellia pseudoproteus]|uniref:DoxX family protein n=1 Tax=Shimwellia pseudoproteus TaxID=570012 RepID=UPI0018EC355F|nr:DoxX family protein [Shimwellia pseudoproteus]MBJ3815844.1 DoxX family protein [Shimwellia pseudoproteus]
MLNRITESVHRPDAARLLLRLTLGGLMLFHGIHKATHEDSMIFVQNKLLNAGLPGFISWGVLVGELLCPILLILGIFTRWSALVVSFTMVMAVYLVYSDRLFTLAPTGAWIIESAALYFLMGIVIFLQGPGRYSIIKYCAWR